MCALCLLVSVLKVIGHFTVCTVVKTVSGSGSDETLNVTIKKIHVLPELVSDHRAAKTLKRLPDKPANVKCISGI